MLGFEATPEEESAPKTQTSGALECNYEKNCTPLYKAIEEENWPSIQSFLQTGYWSGGFWADAVSPQKQARTWVTRFDPRTAAVRWSQLPLHLALVVHAPYEIVGALIELYPEAVRCTDDQHMLPLHLAMKHGSQDRVVDLLLAAFPEAVNAKGKNNRTPIDYATRGPNKVRGRILGTFIERSKGKMAKKMADDYGKKIAELQAQLDEKQIELSDVNQKLDEVETEKTALERSKNAANKDKISELEKQKESLEAEKAQATKDEEGLKNEVEKIRKSLVAQLGVDEIAKQEIAELSALIKAELEKTSGPQREELRAMKIRADDLQRTATFGGDSVDEDKLQEDIATLRAELKAMEDTTKSKVKIALLKEEVENKIKDSTAMTEIEATDATNALNAIKLADLDRKTNAELKQVIDELEYIRRSTAHKSLHEKVSENVLRLRQRASDLSKVVEGADNKKSIFNIDQVLKNIKIGELKSKSDDELLKITKDLSLVRMQFNEIEELVNLRKDLSSHKASLEAESRKATTTKEEKAAISAVLRKFSVKLTAMSKFELLALKNEVENVKYDMTSQRDHMALQRTQKSLKTKINAVKTDATKAISSSEGKEHLSFVVEEATAIKTSIDQVGDLSSKKKEECEDIASSVDDWKAQLSELKKRQNLAESLNTYKLKFEEALKLKRGNKKDLSAALEKVSGISKMSVAELEEAKTHAVRMNGDLQENESVFIDLETIKSTIDDLLQKKSGKQKADLLTLKKTVDAIDLTDMDSKDGKLWDAMKSEIATLKEELENVDIAERTQKEIDQIKTSLGGAILYSQGPTKAELVRIKTAVDAIDTSNLSASKHKEWREIKAEVDGLKKELKANECKTQIENVRSQLKSPSISRVEHARLKKRFDSIDSKTLNKKTMGELAESKRELDSILSEIESSSRRASPARTPSKKPAAGTATPAASSSKKPGFFTRLSSRKSAKKVTKDEKKSTPTTPQKTAPVADAEEKKEDDTAVAASS